MALPSQGGQAPISGAACPPRMGGGVDGWDGCRVTIKSSGMYLLGGVPCSRRDQG